MFQLVSGAGEPGAHRFLWYAQQSGDLPLAVALVVVQQHRQAVPPVQRHHRVEQLPVLGLLERQNEYSTPPFTQKQVVELLDGLRQIAPYVIVDCGSYIANDILSAVALMEADSILRLANCDPKSVNYFASQLPLLDGPEWDMDKQYKVASNVKPYQAADHIGKVLGDTAFVLPYSQELEEQYLAGNLLADLTLKDSRPFRKELERIIAEVF